MTGFRNGTIFAQSIMITLLNKNHVALLLGGALIGIGILISAKEN